MAQVHYHRLSSGGRLVSVRQQWVEAREALVGCGEILLIRREEDIRSREAEVKRREDAVRVQEELVDKGKWNLGEKFWKEVPASESIC